MTNRDDIIRMAKESLMPYYWRTGEITYIDKLEHFADLVAKSEREACAQKVEEMGIDGYGTLAIAASIRAQNSQK